MGCPEVPPIEATEAYQALQETFDMVSNRAWVMEQHLARTNPEAHKSACLEVAEARVTQNEALIHMLRENNRELRDRLANTADELESLVKQTDIMVRVDDAERALREAIILAIKNLRGEE